MVGFAAVATRRDLVAYFSSLDPDVFPSPSRQSAEAQVLVLKPGNVVVTFDEPRPSRGAIPRYIVLHENDVDDFFAWSSTFVEALRPLTAFVEVVSRVHWLAARKPPALTSRQQQGMIAAVLMEGLLQSKARVRLPETILPLCQRTLSAVFYQTTKRGSTPPEITDAGGLWTAVRSALDAPNLAYDARFVLEFWGLLVVAFAEPTGGDADALVQTIRNSAFDSGRTVVWTGPSPEPLPSNLEQFLRAPREERLRAVDDRIRRAARHSVEPLLAGAYSGYLLSLVADGDFSMWSTAAEYREMSTLPMWFALFTGLHPKSNILGFAQSIARRLQRLLLDDAAAVDIDAREFLVGQRARTRPNSIVDFPLGVASVMTARLGVGVRGWFSVREPVQLDRRQQRDVAAESEVGRRIMTAPEILEVRQLAERILSLLNRTIHSAGTIPNRMPTQRVGEPFDDPASRGKPESLQSATSSDESSGRRQEQLPFPASQRERGKKGKRKA